MTDSFSVLPNVVIAQCLFKYCGVVSLSRIAQAHKRMNMLIGRDERAMFWRKFGNDSVRDEIIYEAMRRMEWELLEMIVEKCDFKMETMLLFRCAEIAGQVGSVALFDMFIIDESAFENVDFFHV